MIQLSMPWTKKNPYFTKIFNVVNMDSETQSMFLNLHNRLEKKKQN